MPCSGLLRLAYHLRNRAVLAAAAAQAEKDNLPGYITHVASLQSATMSNEGVRTAARNELSQDGEEHISRPISDRSAAWDSGYSDCLLKMAYMYILASIW